MINLARGTDQLDRLSFDPLKPSFLLAVTKGSSISQLVSAAIFGANVFIGRLAACRKSDLINGLRNAGILVYGGSGHRRFMRGHVSCRRT